MILRSSAIGFLLAALTVGAASGPPPHGAKDLSRGGVITGVVRASDSEAIFAPMAETSPVTLRYLAKDGSPVKRGDTLVRIDPGAALSQHESLLAQIAQTKARIEKEVAEFAVREVDAELALVDAEAGLERAEVDAAIPSDYIARIDFDRYKGELERARRDLELKRGEVQAAGAAVKRRLEDGELELAKLRADLNYAATAIRLSEQKAETNGVVVFEFNAWTGQRYQEGSTTNAGQPIGEVVRPGAFNVRAYALEPDRRDWEVGQEVRLSFDAIHGKTLHGRVLRISGTTQAKAEWGAGRYFVIDIGLPERHGLPLRPGMSVRVMATHSLDVPQERPAP